MRATERKKEGERKEFGIFSQWIRRPTPSVFLKWSLRDSQCRCTHSPFLLFSPSLSFSGSIYITSTKRSRVAIAGGPHTACLRDFCSGVRFTPRYTTSPSISFSNSLFQRSVSVLHQHIHTPICLFVASIWLFIAGPRSMMPHYNRCCGFFSFFSTIATCIRLCSNLCLCLLLFSLLSSFSMNLVK